MGITHSFVSTGGGRLVNNTDWDADHAFTGPITLTGAVGSSALTITGGTQTASFPALSLTQTWNAVGTTFTGALVNVTDTASAAASKLMDLQVGGTPVAYVLKSGRIVTSSTYQTGGISGSEAPTGGRAIVFRSGGIEFMDASNNRDYYMGGVGFTSGSTRFFGFSSGTDAASATDVALYRDAASVLAQRVATTAQTFRLYNTWTDASNYERLGLTWATNVIRIGAANAGTGTARVMTLDYGGTTTAAISVPITSGAVTFGGQVATPAGTTSLASLNIPHGSAPTSPVNGDIWTTTAGLYVRINGATVGPLS